MKENAPKKIRFQTLRTLWVPLAIGVVTVAALAVVVGILLHVSSVMMSDCQIGVHGRLRKFGVIVLGFAAAAWIAL